LRDKLVKDQTLGRIITFIIVALILVQTGNVTRNISAYEKMYQDLGSRVSSLASFFLSTPIWVYWLLSLLFCGVLVVKDHFISEPITRFLSNFLAYLAITLMASIVISIITGDVFDLMNVVK